jgi:uncharacterized protein (DUF488 family)
MGAGAGEIFTVGHSTHTFEGLVRLLNRHDIACLIDVRKIPSSRRMPHFARPQLEQALPAEGIGYEHMPELGGFRKPRPDSANAGWETRGFRGYADYMQTPEFDAALARVEAAGREHPTAIMCAEALWWRCHRRLIADALTVRGWRVLHIDSGGATAEHRLPPFAVVNGTRLSYPPAQRVLDV